MAKLSGARAGVPLLEGLKLFSRGKVRDNYLLPTHSSMVQVATDGVSIFDFVLDALVPEKGIILNAMNHFWLQFLKNFGIVTHFVAAGSRIDYYLPKKLQGSIDLQSRAMIVRQFEIVPVEFIARAVLTGSAIKSYQQDGKICGHSINPGLQDGDLLPYILDTPTTKAQEGHDENLSAQDIRKEYPDQTYTLLKAFQIVSQYARERGIMLADTKLELSTSGVLCDEIFTPDSSRFWELKAWQESRKLADYRKAPPPYDKQIVRQWGIKQGINKLDPIKPEDVVKVHSLVVPDELIRQTTKIYRYIFWRLTGFKIETYLRSKMNICVPRDIKKITIICGSESDLPLVRTVVNAFPETIAKIKVHVMSCHRNIKEVASFAINHSWSDVIIGVGSKALALPGIIDALLYSNKIDIPVIGVALGQANTKALQAAMLSIEELPSAPVIIDEIAGNPYIGEEGLRSAIDRIIDGELPPFKNRTEKPIQIDALVNH